MPALPIVPDGYLAAFDYHSGEASFTNTLAFVAVSTNAGAVGTEFVRAVLNATSGSSWQALISSAAVLDKVRVTPLDGTSPSVETPFPATTNGSGTAPPVPAQVAGIVTLNTGFRGRDRRGRIYMACLPHGLMDADGARWGTSFPADATTWFGTFMTNLGTGSPLLDLGVLSRKNGAIYSVTSFTPRRYLGSIRRRAERQESL